MSIKNLIEQITLELVEEKKLELLNEVSMEQVMLQFDSKKMKKAAARNEEWNLEKVERWLKTPRFQELFLNFIPKDIEDNDRAEGLQWILGLYKKDELGSIRRWTREIVNKHRSNLELFFQQKRFMKQKQLQALDLESLGDVVDEARPAINAHLEKKSYLDAEQGKKVILDNDDWTIYIPTNKGAACELGKNTEWCTAAPGLDYYEEYHTDEDPLIIFIPKHPDYKGEKYQIHFVSDQFMDKDDIAINDIKKAKLISLIKPVKKALAQEIQKKISKYVYKKIGDGREHVQNPYSKEWYLNGKLHREDGPAIERANGDKWWYLNGKQHREDGPAVEYANGDKWWYLNGKRHREDGPAIERAKGDKWWYLNGKYHREDGPAIELANGTKEWYLNGKYHREDGPAFEGSNGTKEWHLNGKLHREDGPAVEYADGDKVWYLDGKEVSQQDVEELAKQKNISETIKNLIEQITLELLDEEWSKSERKKRKKNCDNPKGFTMKQFCKNQKTRSKPGEKTNEELGQDLEETIKKIDDEYVVYPKKGGKRLGTHKTKKAAKKQLAAIEISKAKRG
jgi:hypothetical protein